MTRSPEQESFVDVISVLSWSWVLEGENKRKKGLPRGTTAANWQMLVYLRLRSPALVIVPRTSGPRYQWCRAGAPAPYSASGGNRVMIKRAPPNSHPS